MRLARLAALPAAIGLSLLAFAAPASAVGFNDLGDQYLNGAPHRSVSIFDATTPEFDTSGYTEQGPESAAPTRYLGCSAAGARTAWVGFSTAVAGNLHVIVDSEHDVFYNVYAAPLFSTVFGDLEEIGCINSRATGGEEYFHGHDIPANRTAYVQVLSLCSNGPDPPPPCDPTPDGGPTSVRLIFTPKNTDGDAFADTLDACPTVKGPVGGCPDRDGDGIRDSLDRCPDVAGKDALGCDADGDGHRSKAAGGHDCDDANAKIRPGALDIPGNRVDEDCNGRDKPHPKLKSEVAGRAIFDGRTIVGYTKFTILPAPKGLRVQVICKGPRCPYSSVTKRASKKRRKLTVPFQRKIGRQPAGTVITLRLIRPGYVGRMIKYTIRAKGKPRVQTFCLRTGSKKVWKKGC